MPVGDEQCRRAQTAPQNPGQKVPSSDEPPFTPAAHEVEQRP